MKFILFEEANMNRKQKQLAIILANNPCYDDYHTWIRSEKDICTFEEVLNDEEYKNYDVFIEDFSRIDALNALSVGKIMVYSSQKITPGIFVTPSKLEAKGYAGNGKIYQKVVLLTDVAWIDILQGQYAKID